MSDKSMSYTEKVEFLNGYYRANIIIKGLREEQQRWRDVGVDIAQKYSNTPIMQGESEGKISKSVTGVIGIGERIHDELNRALMERDNVYNVINSVQNRRHRIILYMHHISMMSFGAIAGELSKTERNVYKVYKKAVNELEI